MNIVVLDGYTLNAGELNWDTLHRLGNVAIYDRTPAELVEERCRGAEVVLTNKTPLRGDTLAKLPELRYIGVLATGYDVVDVRRATEQGIVVTNVPSYSTASVAQLVFALLLELCHRVQWHSDAVRGGEWSRSADFCFWKSPLIELAGKTIGIVGYGRIGEDVAKIAAAFGMNLLAYKRTPPTEVAVPGLQFVTLDELFAQSDVVTLHCPLTAETDRMINEQTLPKMKTNAFLINTARGKLIDEQALAAALDAGTIAGAALDVLSAEPPEADHPLVAAKNCIITPHIAWATKEARERLLLTAVTNIDAFISGIPVNVVSPR